MPGKGNMNFLIACLALTAPDSVGQPVDIAPSAYQYRADRTINPPESFIALKHFAHQPLNQPLSPEAAKGCLRSFLWEEIRPVQRLVLTWAKEQTPGDIKVSALINDGGSSSWWNNLRSVPQDVKPIVSDGGCTLTYELGINTCGLVVSSSDPGAKVPEARVFVADAWKKMDVEVEWGFDRADKDYSGRVEAYDGRTTSKPWTSKGRGSTEFSLLYMGTSRWRKQQPYTTQAEDVARTIVTVWTKAGNFSFLAADLENGPIYAPEYGFFVHRTKAYPSSASASTTTAMMTKMTEVAGDSNLRAWGSDQTPWLGSNPTDHVVNVQGIQFPAGCVAMHPGSSTDVVVEWRSPIDGKVSLAGALTHAQAGSNGIEWWVNKNSHALQHGTTKGTGRREIEQAEISVNRGDLLSLIVGANTDYRCDTNIVELTIRDATTGRQWDLRQDVGSNLQESNPHRDGFGNPNVWRFGSRPAFVASEPPISLASKATTAKQFLRELAAKKQKTIRQLTREHAEQTWLGAITATRGPNLPAIPAPPHGTEPAMQVEVPSPELNAQWNLGAWHLVRHCATNPTTGKLWFNDFPYGILAAETYLVLSVLDQMGSHDAAADGLDQWLSLSMERDHPVGLFTDGQGALTNAVGPDGYGGQMDGIHSFGPGSIGWALTQHYWLTHDKAWLKANAPRMIANADWMLRQRRVVSDSVPGGSKLWCNGLQPPLQVTPDSGGLWMQFYECEAYYWASISRLAETVAVVDSVNGARLRKEAAAYQRDLKAAVERSIALSPVVPVRDGTYHSVIPFACYVRGLSTNAWGWQRDGSGAHVGPLYWDTVQSAAALVSPAGLLPANDPRVQGNLDVLEDRLLLENPNVGNRDWFGAGWQYQGGLERTANMHLTADDVPVFLRSFLNCYAVDILPNDGYTFNEHAVHGPPDKIFEEAAFLERFRNLLVMEDGDTLWLARATPRAWLEQGKHVSVKQSPTRFGVVDYEIRSDVDHGVIHARITAPSGCAISLRLRHPEGRPIKWVEVDGKKWKNFDAARELIKVSGSVAVDAHY